MQPRSCFRSPARRALVVLLLGLAPLCTAIAQPSAMPFNPLQLVEQWGQVLYCQQAYRHADNVSRVYAYDTGQCATAARFLEGQIAQFPEDVRSEMSGLAERQAAKILANTRDIRAVLDACRETCQAIAAEAAPLPDSAVPATADPQP